MDVNLGSVIVITESVYLVVGKLMWSSMVLKRKFMVFRTARQTLLATTWWPFPMSLYMEPVARNLTPIHTCEIYNLILFFIVLYDITVCNLHLNYVCSMNIHSFMTSPYVIVVHKQWIITSWHIIQIKYTLNLNLHIILYIILTVRTAERVLWFGRPWSGPLKPWAFMRWAKYSIDSLERRYVFLNWTSE